MKKLMKWGLGRIWIIGLILMLVVSSCSNSKFAGDGDATETGNHTIAGVINDQKGPTSGVTVTLYPEDFNPATDQVPDSLIEITDSEGAYFFKVADVGTYNIQAFRPEDKTAAIIQSVEVPSLDVDTVITVPQAELKPPGSMIIHLEELKMEEGGLIYIPGTDVYAEIDAEDLEKGFVLIESSPVGTYPAIFFHPTKASPVDSLLHEDLQVGIGEIAVVGPYYPWSDTAKITINTSFTGANVSEDIYKFPLLIRLDNSSGVFADSDSAGADLRFAKPDGISILPYEIERWDASNQVAEVWVLVDSILGNNNNQNIYMYWNKADATPRTSGNIVFDTANGYTGVWHLGEEDGRPSNPINAFKPFKDATANSNHGYRRFSSSPLAQQGVIGVGKKFFGVPEGSIEIDTTHLNLSNPFTIQVWIKQDVIESGVSTNEFFTKHGVFRYGINHEDSLNLQHQKAVYGDRLGGLRFSQTPLDTGLWHHLSMISDGIQMTFYLNGLPDGVTAQIEPVMDHPSKAYIGSGHGGAFNGVMDEMIISNTVRTPSWIKMSFENQKDGSKVVVIE